MTTGLVDHLALEAGDAAAAGVGLLNGGHDEARFVQIFLAGHEDAVQRLDLPRVDDGLAVEASFLMSIASARKPSSLLTSE